jgi:hypothetical protein
MLPGAGASGVRSHVTLMARAINPTANTAR